MKTIDVSDLLGVWFHDVEVGHISVDYASRVVELECIIPVGAWNSPNRLGITNGEIKGCLVFSGLLYFVMEPPASNYPYEDGSAIVITSEGPVMPGKIDMSYVSKLPQDLSDDAFLHWFFVNDWNAFIFVAATGVSFHS